MQAMHFIMQKERETTNKVLYKAIDANGKHIETIYVHKAAMNGDTPEEIVVTVEAHVTTV